MASPPLVPGRDDTPTSEWSLSENKLLADIPFLTVGMIVILLLIYAFERKLAIDIGKDGDLNLRSLIAYGATSRDLVVGAAEWWRIGLAPLLHASSSHVFGNCIALFFVGIRLEPMIGRGWFTAIFVAAAFGGEAGSLLGNPPGIPSVGASGAITGLVAALFVMSFNPYADGDQRRKMRRTALFFGVPALLPLAWGASGGVDYFGHAGGALAGGAIGVVLWGIWSYDSIRPNHARRAGIAALAGVAFAMVCVGFAGSRYSTHMASAKNFIGASELPANMRDITKRSADLLARYPKDPRAHFFRAISLIEDRRFGDAEAALRTAMAISASDVAGGPVRSQAQAVLAGVLAEQGRHGEAKILAVEACRARASDPMRRELAKLKLCD